MWRIVYECNICFLCGDIGLCFWYLLIYVWCLFDIDICGWMFGIDIFVVLLFLCGECCDVVLKFCKEFWMVCCRIFFFLCLVVMFVCFRSCKFVLCIFFLYFFLFLVIKCLIIVFCFFFVVICRIFFGFVFIFFFCWEGW